MGQTNHPLLPEPPRDFRREVGDDHIGSGTADAGEYFGDDAALVDPAILGGSFNHGVFAADVVGGDGQIAAVAHLANYVEVGEGGLDHDDIGPLGDIQCDLAQGFAGVGGVHLVGTAIAELRRGTGGLSEGSVEAGGELGGVGHDGRLLKALLIQQGADRADTTIHHVGGRNDIRASFDVREGHVAQQLQCFVVLHIAVLDDAAMPVAGVFTQANVGDDQRIRCLGLQTPDRLLDDALLGVCLRAYLVLLVGDAKEQYGWNAQARDALRFTPQVLQRPLHNPWHGGNLAWLVDAFRNEERVDELLDVQVRLADHAAQPIVLARAP